MASRAKLQVKQENSSNLFGYSPASKSGSSAKASPQQQTPSITKVSATEILSSGPVTKIESGAAVSRKEGGDNSDDSDTEDNDEESQSQMDLMISDLYEKVNDGSLSVDQVQVILEYIERKLKEGLPESFIVSMISRPDFLLLVMKSNVNACSNSSTQSQVLSESNQRTAKAPYSERDQDVNHEKVDKSLRTQDVEWLKFSDEYDSDVTLDKIEREIWSSELKAKIRLIENLQKEVTEQMNHKKFPKYKTGDVYQRWLKGIRTEILPIPFCEMRFEHGPLTNPRRKPDPRAKLFEDVTGVFDSKSYESALILYNLLDALAIKISSFLYSTITFCMSDNADALRVINAERDKDYYSLLYKLSARFKESSEVERERLVDELNAAKRERNETIRAFYGRLSTIATELRTIFDRPVQDEDIKRVLLRELSEASKNNFLHLEMMPKYEKQFNELCLEVIKRDEILQKTIGNSEVVNNVTSDSGNTRYRGGRFRGGRFQGGRSQGGRSNVTCHYCHRLGHIARDCKTKEKHMAEEQEHVVRTAIPRNDKKLGKFSDKAHSRRRSRELDEDNEANQVSTKDCASDVDGVECYYCHERDSHLSADCPNSNVTVELLNHKYKEFTANNVEADRLNRHKIYRIA